MKSELLQKKSYILDQSDEELERAGKHRRVSEPFDESRVTHAIP
jgi:hypothetical protein